MPTKVVNYIEFELKWLEAKIQSLMKFLDEHGLEDVQDRTETYPSPKGLVVKTMATIEQQSAAYRAALKDLPALLRDLNELRKIKAESDITARGNAQVPGIMMDRMKT